MDSQPKMAQIEYMPDLLVLKNPNARLVDSVAYLDEQTEFTDEVKQKAAKLVRAQMKQMDAKKDYLEDFPQPNLPKIDSSEIQAEIDRVIKEKEAPNDETKMTVDETKYLDVEEPDKNNVQAWNKALETAEINNSVSENQRLNLELDKQFGTAVWQENLVQQQHIHEYLQKQTYMVENQINEINKKRKFSQVNQVEKFKTMDDKVKSFYKNNMDLECEIVNMEAKYEQAKKVRKINDGDVTASLQQA